MAFQSTRPIRGATERRRLVLLHDGISIHAPHTGRDVPMCRSRPCAPISIHAPHTGRDRRPCRRGGGDAVFQSTRPIRGATGSRLPRARHLQAISIHAPHTGRDRSRICPLGARRAFQSTRPIRGATLRSVRQDVRNDFNPRAPYGARPFRRCGSSLASRFQSTRPIRGATRCEYE